VVLYFGKLWRVAFGMFSNAEDRRFVIGLLVAFLARGGDRGRRRRLYQGLSVQSLVVCFSLIVGGAILLWVDQLDHDPHQHDATKFPLPMYLSIGFAQCLR